MNPDPTQPAQEQAKSCPWHAQLKDDCPHCQRASAQEHAPSEGQTGETRDVPETDAKFQSLLSNAALNDNGRFVAMFSFACAQERTITTLEAQLAAMREAVKAVSDFYHGGNVYLPGPVLAKVLRALESTSGQALLDRIKQLEEENERMKQTLDAIR